MALTWCSLVYSFGHRIRHLASAVLYAIKFHRKMAASKRSGASREGTVLLVDEPETCGLPNDSFIITSSSQFLKDVIGFALLFHQAPLFSDSNE